MRLGSCPLTDVEFEVVSLERNDLADSLNKAASGQGLGGLDLEVDVAPIDLTGNQDFVRSRIKDLLGLD